MPSILGSGHAIRDRSPFVSAVLASPGHSGGTERVNKLALTLLVSEHARRRCRTGAQFGPSVPFYPIRMRAKEITNGKVAPPQLPTVRYDAYVERVGTSLAPEVPSRSATILPQILVPEPLQTIDRRSRIAALKGTYKDVHNRLRHKPGDCCAPEMLYSKRVPTQRRMNPSNLDLVQQNPTVVVRDDSNPILFSAHRSSVALGPMT